MGREHYPYLPLTESQLESLREKDLSDREIYEIRQRIQHTLANGYVIWAGLGIDRTTFKTIGGPTNNRRHFDRSDIEETKRFHQGLIGWLAFLYAGIEEQPNLKLTEFPEYVNERSMKGPNTYFGFELMLREAINKVENRRGRKITDFSLEIETEPIPKNPSDSFDTEELLTRFNERDPKLSSVQLAHLQQEGIIDGNDVSEFLREADFSQEESDST